MKILYRLFLGCAILFLMSCGSKTIKLEEKEEIYGTGGEDLSVFHKILEQDKGFIVDPKN